MDPRPVWLIPPPRPETPPWVRTDRAIPGSSGGWVEGTLLEWRMVDPDTREWTGLVQYSIAGLTYRHWMPGSELRNEPPAQPGRTASRTHT